MYSAVTVMSNTTISAKRLALIPQYLSGRSLQFLCSKVVSAYFKYFEEESACIFKRLVEKKADKRADFVD